MIRYAKISQISEILNLTRTCAAHMIQNGIHQWNEHYPSRKAFENDIEQSELYVFEKDNQIIGTITISTLMDEEYLPVQWLTPDSKNMYIHRLSVHPALQGQGYAQKLMDFAENHAKAHGFISIRLDTFSQNQRNQKFYESRGYHKLGDIYFPNQSAHPFHCYELVL